MKHISGLAVLSWLAYVKCVEVTSNLSLEILIDNVVRPEDLNAKISYLLVKTPVQAHEAAAACQSLGEQLATSYNSKQLREIFAKKQFDHDYESIDYMWGIKNGNGCQGFSLKSSSSVNLDCSKRYPALCTNTAPLQTTSFHPPTDKKYIVDTKLGKVQGYRDRVSFRFDGIPYAKPPVGDLRFKAPQPIDKLTSDGTVHDATYFRPMCPQNITNDPGPQMNTTMSEDCLYLTIYTPFLPGNKAEKDKLLPVMVWYHGGSYYYGGSSQVEYNGNNFASRESVVVVSVDYRLGVLGWLSTPDQIDSNEGSINQAMRDQIMALQWVNDHIKAYGGDSEKVTIIGESAGGTTIMSLLQTDATKGLFANAIVESGNPLSGWQRPDIGTELSKLYLNISNCENIQCLKKIQNTTQLIEYQDALFAKAQEVYPPGQVNWIEPFRPVIDNDLLKEDQFKALQNGNFQKVPTLVTYNHDEFGLFLQENQTFANSKYTNFSTAVEFLSTFQLGPKRTQILLDTPMLGFNKSLNGTDVSEALVQFTTNYAYRCNLEIYAGTLEQQNKDIWELTWEINVPQFINGSLCSAEEKRVCHATEIMLWFGSAAYYDLTTPLLDSQNYFERARNAMDLYGRFVRNGKLISNTSTAYPLRGSDTTHNVLHWNDKPYVKEGGVNWKQCEMMEKMSFYDRQVYPYKG
ncbi:hypothetical protein INT43_005364 [Umbelopsis isabellina]|uniref:Carboxylesterase type B domain-containing protein n=1 Tax=Mortierella isabellina TaxID=91625 RepID=A0A8H7PMX4_MORIS|nr:hypothetical protein INT43_005364 [Umbelopsis isabellina]